ncbi:MAG TPA: PSD1 and planctomycete cytochrome C domain-containing protein [Tepidisphaeraceae bacterium]|nr:PSD1 and planctomycete cytochrome C domain-containing protein [Tepidisphaeraceae bacterium]
MPRPRAILLLLCALCVAAVKSSAAPPAPDFNRDVRPILAENCLACHGFDEKARKGKLRLDVRDAALAKAAFVPLKPDESEAVKRILTNDPDDRMPPPESGKTLTAKQVDTLRRWVAAGATYDGHWSFEPVRATAVPQTKAKWGRNEIDPFILAKLESDQLSPSPETTKETLIRRVTFDLTGLPPTPAEVDAFVRDAAPEAYEKVVDRLLASPHFGERMAVDWLDAARYADTHGYHLDSGRDMTAWREWVIDAFNRNMPFDQFTVHQLAGDLLPDATVQSRIASGFNRNHMINFEGGAVAEEYLTAYLVDRVNTTGTVWMGLSVGCAQCHDHKYDPITQKEFYRLYAFFNNVPEAGLDGSRGNAKPFIRTPSKQHEATLAALQAEAADIARSLDKPDPAADAAQVAWEPTALASGRTAWTRTPDKATVSSAGGATLTRQPDGSYTSTGTNPFKESLTVKFAAPARTTAVRFDVFPDPKLNGKGPGRSDNGNIVLTEVKVFVGDAKLPAKLKYASADFAQKDFPASNAIDGQGTSGWAIDPQEGKPHHLIVQPMDDIPAGSDVRVVVEFNSQFASHHPGRFALSTTDSPNPHGAAVMPDDVAAALKAPADKRTEAQASALRRYFRASHLPAYTAARDRLQAVDKQRDKLDADVRTTMVMEEMTKPRDTFILTRGEYDKKGEKVTAGTPAALPPLPKDAPVNRLGLAKWLVSPEHPLTARVAVNRYWQAYFGVGLVKTVEDFGLQGDSPTHPELLDYLAKRFVDSGWDVKAMQRLIVTSAAYRQSSAVTPALVAKDPENRLLARGPRFRLSAEQIRDQALAISGLLNREIGGKSVSPYQPAGLWEELMSREDGDRFSAQKYVQSHGPDLYRRTMYTFWKRTSPPPTLATFDAPDREICTVRRSRTNTPLQALVLMNDPTYVEASRKLAERAMSEVKGGNDQRLSFLFRLATARQPSADELAILTRALTAHTARYTADPAAAEKLLKNGESPVSDGLPKPELAAWTMLSSIILNLDEVVTKN